MCQIQMPEATIPQIEFLRYGRVRVLSNDISGAIALAFASHRPVSLVVKVTHKAECVRQWGGCCSSFGSENCHQHHSLLFLAERGDTCSLSAEDLPSGRV